VIGGKKGTISIDVRQVKLSLIQIVHLRVQLWDAAQAPTPEHKINLYAV
jgi:hypothetical protein